MENAHTGYTLPSPGKYWMQALSPSASLRGNKCACCQHPALHGPEDTASLCQLL